MAEKSKGGGGFFWFVLGTLLGVALTLGALLFLNAGPISEAEAPSTAHEAAATAAAASEPAAVEPAQLPPPSEKTIAPTPRHDAGIDPHGDDQMAEDAAAAGMTSRTPSPQPE